MDSNTKHIINSALIELKETGVSYVLLVEDEEGVAIFSNSDGDRFYLVN